MATTAATANLQVDIIEEIQGVRNALKGLSLGMWKMHKGLTASLRSEFSSQNKLLGWQGKNLQLIAQAITQTSASLIKQMQDDARKQAEATKEAAAAGKTGAGAVAATDASMQLDISDLGGLPGIAAALSGLAIGFLAQISAPVIALAQSIKGGLASIGKMFMKNRMVKEIIFRAKWLWIDIKFAVQSIKGNFVRFKNAVTAFFKKPFVSNKLILGIKNAILGPWKLLSKGPVTLFKTIAADVKAFMGMFKGSGTGFLGKLKNFFTNFKAMFSMKGGFIDDIMKAVTKFKGVFKFFMKIGRFLGKAFVIFQVITAMFDFWGGFVETEGNFVAKVAGGLGAAIKGFLGGFLDIGIMIEDGIKWIITKIAGFLGFDEAAVSGAMGSFSFFGTIKDALFGAIDYLVDLFKFEDLTMGGIAKSLFDIVFAPLNLAIDFLLDLFGWKSDPEEDFKLSTFVTEAFGKAVAWVTGIFSWAGDAIASGWTSLTGFVSEKWELVKAWFTALVSWGKETAKESWIVTTIDGIVTTVKTWFSNLFSWASTEDDSDSFIIKTIKNAVNLAKEWLGSMFKFDSTSDILASAFNALTFLPNMVWKGVTAVASWLAGLFGFDEASKKIANAGSFSLGDMLFSAIDSIWKWFKGLLDIDVMGIVKSIPGGETLMSLFGAGEADKSKKALADMGIAQASSDWGDWDMMDQEKQIRAAAKNMDMGQLQAMASQITAVGAAGDIDSDDLENVQNLLMELGREKAALLAKQRGSGGAVINQTTIQQNSSQALVAPPTPVSAGNGDNPAKYDG